MEAPDLSSGELWYSPPGLKKLFLRDGHAGPDYGQLCQPDYPSLWAENADVALRYINDAPASHPNIFNNAKLNMDAADPGRLIGVLGILAPEENLGTAKIRQDKALAMAGA